MSLENIFKKTVFVEEQIEKHGVEKAFTLQLSKVSEELFEAQSAMGKKDYFHAIEEVIDSMHAAMQLNYIIPTYDKGIADYVAGKVKIKNINRGYYEI